MESHGTREYCLSGRQTFSFSVVQRVRLHRGFARLCFIYLVRWSDVPQHRVSVLQLDNTGFMLVDSVTSSLTQGMVRECL
jgi:hypothetical protein